MPSRTRTLLTNALGLPSERELEVELRKVHKKWPAATIEAFGHETDKASHGSCRRSAQPCLATGPMAFRATLVAQGANDGRRRGGESAILLPATRRKRPMRDPLSEAEGSNLLARLFRARGYAIKRNVMFREGDVEFRVDGWDAKARVGFEFLSSEAADHEDMTLGEFKRLMAAQQRGELALFVIDESEQLSAQDLTHAADEFLDAVSQARPRRRAAPRRSPAKKPAARGPSSTPRRTAAARGKKAARKRR